MGCPRSTCCGRSTRRRSGGTNDWRPWTPRTWGPGTRCTDTMWPTTLWLNPWTMMRRSTRFRDTVLMMMMIDAEHGFEAVVRREYNEFAVFFILSFLSFFEISLAHLSFDPVHSLCVVVTHSLVCFVIFTICLSCLPVAFAICPLILSMWLVCLLASRSFTVYLQK